MKKRKKIKREEEIKNYLNVVDMIHSLTNLFISGMFLLGATKKGSLHGEDNMKCWRNINQINCLRKFGNTNKVEGMQYACPMIQQVHTLGKTSICAPRDMDKNVHQGMDNYGTSIRWNT